MVDFTVGHDAEVFIKRKGRGAGLLSAIGRVPGTKEEPHHMGNISLHCDNVLAELNIKPATTADEFVSLTNEALRKLTGLLEPYDAEIAILTSADMPLTELYDPGAHTFGCDSDFDAYTKRQSDPVYVGGMDTLRTAGGHIHIGIPDLTQEAKLMLARMCDLCIGLPSVLVDTDQRRRSMYGQAGKFRYKPYGMEYRTVSNFWLTSDRRMRWVFNVVEDMVLRMDEISEFLTEAIVSNDERIGSVATTINSANAAEAKNLVGYLVSNGVIREDHLQALQES